MIRKCKRWLVCVMVWVLVVTEVTMPVQAQAPEHSELYAKAAVLMDAASGRVLYEKNGQEILAMASTTKILTCIIALENADLDEWVEVSAYASTMPKVKLYIKKGEKYRLGDLLYSLMLESHNDVAVAIAEHLGKEFLEKELQEKSVAEYTTKESKAAVAAFAGLMNEKASQLGCENSWFITPNGLDATETFTKEDGMSFFKNHSTTATDLATIMSYCVLHSPKREQFLEITQTISHSFASMAGRNFFCTNHNAFLTMMEGAISGKTGFTNQAGYCYVGALEQDGRTYVVALLACGWPNNKSYKWSDTKKLMTYGVEEFVFHAFEEAAGNVQVPEKLPVFDGQTGYIGQQAYVQTGITATEAEGERFGEIEGLLLSGEEEIEVSCDMVSGLQAPVYEGDVIGTITYEVEGVCYKKEDIYLKNSVPKVDFQWCIRAILEKYMCGFW